jgi:hypothetical protein
MKSLKFEMLRTLALQSGKLHKWLSEKAKAQSISRSKELRKAEAMKRKAANLIKDAV